MKTQKAYEHEFTFHGTPAQFLAYLRRMAKKYPGEMCNDFSLREFAHPAEEWDSSYYNALPDERPCESETCKIQAFEQQTYIRNFDGTTYNEILEFAFEDETTGSGYYYTVQIDVADEDRAANTAENVAKIASRRAAQADRQEAKAEKIEAEADKANRDGYAAKWWIEGQRAEAASLRREAAETRAAIKAAQEAQEAPETTPAAEPVQQPSETQNAPQTATQAATTDIVVSVYGYDAAMIEEGLRASPYGIQGNRPACWNARRICANLIREYLRNTGVYWSDFDILSAVSIDTSGTHTPYLAEIRARVTA